MRKLVAVIMIAIAFCSGNVNAAIPVKNNTIEQSLDVKKSTKVENSVEKSTLKSLIKKENKKSTTPGGAHDDEFWITLALWFFLGGLAAHRWYRGKPTGWNILFILTGGGCGIWAIVDLINILTGKF
jgi:hypothetical protein